MTGRSLMTRRALIHRNELKTIKTSASYVANARAGIEYFKNDVGCTGNNSSLGICLGGHLAFRAAMNTGVDVCACFPISE